MTTQNSSWFRSTLIAGVLAASTAMSPMVAYASRAELERTSQAAAGQGARPSNTAGAPDANEVAELSERQRAASPLADFAGGEPVIIIGVSTLLVILLVVLLVFIIT
jgi:hypothetical protein